MSSFVMRKATNNVGTGLALLCVLLAVVPLAAMMIYVLEQGWSSINLDFFTQVPAPAGSSGGGMSSQIVGTLVLIVLASVVGLPIGILSGIYLSRPKGGAFPRAVRFVTDVIAGTPSIVAGIVAYALVVIPTGHFSGFAGGIALGLLMFPTVTRATEETIRLVPAAVREAGLALGLPEWRTMMRIVIPSAAAGIVTAIMLGVARVAGETAPLVFTVLGNPALVFSPNSEIGALPLQIWTYATGPYDNWHRQAWAGAFVLFAIIVLLNLTARLLTYRLSTRVGNS